MSIKKINNNNSIEIKRKKLLPVINHYFKLLKLEELIDKYFPEDKRENIKKSKVLFAIISNIIIANKPLYELKEWLLNLDYQSIEITKTEALFINDDKASRSLDAFYNGKHKEFFFELTLNIINTFSLNCSQLHNDGTTVNVYGSYKNQTAVEEITYGKSKHIKANLKQLLLGITATSDGYIPISHYIKSGNYSESKVHIKHFENLRRLLGEQEFIYVADSKLSSENNLQTIHNSGGKFITILPRSATSVYEEITKDIAEIKWINTTLKDYYYSSKKYKSNWNQDIFIYWIYSKDKEMRDRIKRYHFLTKAIKELIKVKRNLNKYKYKTREYINTTVEKIISKNKIKKLLNFEIIEENNKFSIKFSINIKEYRNQQKMYGKFPLITNTNKNPEEVLQIYKQQSFIEKKFTHLKSYQQVAPVYLKKTTRVVAYLHIQVISLIISSLIERTINSSNAQLNIYPEDRKCNKVTIYDLNRLFEFVESYTVNDNISFNTEFSQDQRKIIEILGLDPDNY